MRTSIAALLYFVIALISSNGYANCDAGTATLEGFTRLIRNGECAIRSVNDVLAHLPPKALANYALFYRSRSLQGPHEIDYLNPRALVSGGTEAVPTVFSFNGSPSEPGYRSLELVEIHRETPSNEFRYYEISFPYDDQEASKRSWSDVQAGIQISGANPPRCLACHGSPARPIFPGYPVWEGAFASQSHATMPTEESEGLRQYLEKISGPLTSRYQHLSPLTASGDKTPDIKQIGYALEFANFALNFTLGEANATRVSALIRKTPAYEEYKYALAATFAGCGPANEFVPPPLLTDLLANINARAHLRAKWQPQNIEAMYQRISKADLFLLSDYQADSTDSNAYAATKAKLNARIGFDPVYERLQLDTFFTQGLVRGDPMAGDLRLLTEARGLDIGGWFMDLTQPTYRYHDGTDASSATAREMAATDPNFDAELKRRFARPGYHGGLVGSRDEFMKRAEEANRAARCDRLKKLSLAALRGVRAPGVPTMPRAVQLASNYPKVFQKVCVQCHNTTGTALCAEIPFQSPLEMNRWMSAPANARKIQARILAPDESERMPPTGPLSSEDLISVLKYVGQH